MTPTRRELLAWTLQALVWGPAGWAGATPARPRRSGAAVAIGRAYLAARPLEADARALEASLLAALGGAPGLHSRAGPALERAVSRDFARGAVVTLEGWVLSVTECRLCAWLSLTPPPWEAPGRDRRR